MHNLLDASCWGESVGNCAYEKVMVQSWLAFDVNSLSVSEIVQRLSALIAMCRVRCDFELVQVDLEMHV